MDSPSSLHAAAAPCHHEKEMEANVTSVQHLDGADEPLGLGGRQATTGTANEPPKRLVRGPWVHTIGRLAFHAPAVVISIVLVFVNASNYYWFEMETNVWVSEALQLNTTNILHMLQIAAKVYELLILLSLSVISLGIYRKMLITTGLPLGLITAGYRTGSLVYLKHSGLLTGLRVHYRYVLFGLFVIFTTVLSVLAGPACAILVVPTPGWWPVGGRYASIMPPITYQYTSEEIWPAVVDDSVVADEDGPFSQCSRLGAIYDSRCPGYGFLAISNWAANWALSKLAGNVTVETYRTVSTIQRQIYSDVPANGAATFTTTSSSPTELVLGAYYDAVTHRDNEPKSIFHTGRTRFRTSDQESNYQPLTQTHCQAFDMDDIRAAARANKTSAYPYWPVDRLECFGDAACEAWRNLPADKRTIDPSYWDIPLANLLAFSFKWVETTTPAGGPGPLVAVFYVPYLVFPPSNNRSMDDLSGVRQSRFFVTCSFAARWVPATLAAELSQTNTMQSNITSPGLFWTRRGDLDRAAVGKPVQLRKSWADYLDFNITGINSNVVRAGSTGAASTFLASFIHCYAGDDASPDLMLDCNFGYLDSSVDQASSVPRTVERVLGTSVTDGLSRVRLSHGRVQNYIDPIVIEDVSPDTIRFRHLTRTYFLSPTSTPQNYTIVPNPGNDTYPSIEIFYRDANNTLWEPFTNTMDAWAKRLRGFKSFDLIVERNGYGLGMPSPTLTFALAIVCLYLATVISYTIASLVLLAYGAFQEGSGLHIGGIVGWGDIQDLVTLAWTSRSPPELSNVGAGVKFFSDTWRRVAVVRVNERGDLELVSKENGSGDIPERGKYYG